MSARSGLDRMKRVFTGVELTCDDLAEIAAVAGSTGAAVEMRANRTIVAADELAALLDDEVMFTDVTIVAADGDGHHLRFAFLPSELTVSCDPSPRLARPFHRIAALLAAKPSGNGPCWITAAAAQR